MPFGGMTGEWLQVTVEARGKDREDILRSLTAAADDFFQGAPYALRGRILVDAETETYVTSSGVKEVVRYSAIADYVSIDERWNS